jgi:hypothetical protein
MPYVSQSSNRIHSTDMQHEMHSWTDYPGARTTKLNP